MYKMEFENNFWNKFLLSNIFKTRAEMKKGLVAYRDDGDLIFLFKNNKSFGVKGWNTETKDFFSDKDIDLAYILLTKTPTTKIINQKNWEEFKREVALNELMKNETG